MTRHGKIRQDHPPFGNDPNHVYAIDGEDWRHVGDTRHGCMYASLGDPDRHVTYDFATLHRMNEEGRITVQPFALMPDSLRPHGTPERDDVDLGLLSERHRKRVNHRYAMVRGFLDLQERTGLKGTDEAITGAMDQIVEAARDYLVQDLPDPESALAQKEFKAGRGRKPKTRGHLAVPDPVSSRTLRSWVTRCRKGGKKALVDNCAAQGNRNSRYGPEEIRLLAEVVEQEYLTLQRKPVTAVVMDVKLAFREENRRRFADGLAALRVPGREAVRGHVRSLDRFRVLVARYGQQAAMRKMRASAQGPEALRPFQRVEMDEWKIDLLAVMSRSGLLKLFSTEELADMGLLGGTKRWWLVVAIDCRTRCIAGMTLTANPRTSGAIRCLRMVTNDKRRFADAVHACAEWSVFGTPETLAVDNGSAFKSVAFTTACADLGLTKIQTIAGQPEMRGCIERVFNTLGTTLMPRLNGRTFGDVVTRAGHPAEERACLDLEDIAFALVRWVVDIYHNTPHEGLAGRTPLEQWEADLDDGNYPLKAAPSAEMKRVAFGLPLRRKVQKDGLRVMNVRYHSERLARWFLANGRREVNVRWFDGEIGSVAAELDGEWHGIPAVSAAFQGVDASTWAAARRALRGKDPRRKAWEENVVLKAIADIEAMNGQKALACGIVDHEWTEERFRKVEKEAMAPFDVVPARRPASPTPDGYGMSILPVAPSGEGRGRTATPARQADTPLMLATRDAGEAHPEAAASRSPEPVHAPEDRKSGADGKPAEDDEWIFDA